MPNERPIQHYLLFSDLQSVSVADTFQLLGPEGGWSDAEREQIAATSIPIVRFGVFVLRIEAAACAGSAIVLSSVPIMQGKTS